MPHNWLSSRGSPAGEQALSGAGAVLPDVSVCRYTSTGAAEALTLADGSASADGHEITVVHAVDGGDGDLTPANFLNGTLVNLVAVGDSVTLKWNETLGTWIAVGLVGATIT